MIKVYLTGSINKESSWPRMIKNRQPYDIKIQYFDDWDYVPVHQRLEEKKHLIRNSNYMIWNLTFGVDVESVLDFCYAKQQFVPVINVINFGQEIPDVIEFQTHTAFSFEESYEIIREAEEESNKCKVLS